MAIGFERVKNVHSNVMNAAGYRLGIQIEGGRDYSYKSNEVVASGVILPDQAPAEFQDIAILTQAWQKAEDKYNQNTRSDKKVRTAKELIIALPVELSREQQERLIRQYTAKIAEDGHAVIWSIHDKMDGNPHAHILISPRKIVKGGINHGKAITRKSSTRATDIGSNRSQNTPIQGRNRTGEDLALCHMPSLNLDSSQTAYDLLLPGHRRAKLDKQRERQVKSRDVRSLVATELIDCWAKTKSKKVYSLDNKGERIPVIDPETGKQRIGERGRKMWKRETIDQNELDQNDWRLAQEERWEHECNAALAAAGRTERISMAQTDKHGKAHMGNPNRQTQKHLGQAAAAMEMRGKTTETGNYNMLVGEINQAAAALANKTAEAAALESALAAIKPSPVPAQNPPTTAQNPPSQTDTFAGPKKSPDVAISQEPRKSTLPPVSTPASAPVSEARIGVLDDGMSKFLVINRPGKSPLVAGIIANDGGKPRLGPVLDTSQTAAVLATANIEYQKAMSALSSASLGKLAPSPSGGTGAVQRDLMAEMSEESRLEIEEILQMRVNTARMQAEIAADQHRQAIAAAAQLQGRGR